MFSTVILWHMHQPYYVNPLTQTAMMPWVRLHCVKGYLDMVDAATAHPDLRVNFNFTPVLIKEILELSEGKVKDLWEGLSRKSPEYLSDEEKIQILENFFKIHWDNHIYPFPRYLQLLELRGQRVTRESLTVSIKHFTDQDYRDLQTWYNLSWCGFSAEKRFPELKEFKRRRDFFTEEEKHRVLDIHREIVKSILPLYRQAQEQGFIELTTTPFYHPIMPLVYDTDFAKRCMPGRALPPKFTAPEDVLAQLQMAQEQHTAVFGKPARGMWPSEGSVCPEVIPLMEKVGIHYFLTDEGILFQSLRNDPAWKGRSIDHLELFQPWNCKHEGSEVKALFRERPLSDFIGFNAARNTTPVAVDHMIFNMEHIASIAPRSEGVLCLALDGENVWESFPDGGEEFLRTFYQKCTRSEKIKTRLLGEYFERVTQSPVIKEIHSGSWINSNFDIWIGDEEENQGWEWLGKTRHFLVEQLKEKKWPEAVIKAAWDEIYAAEGSDWFWWYGPDFETECDFLFDELFRTHLKNVYQILGVESPRYLDIPICSVQHSSAVFTEPFDWIEPIINGESTSFFDWLGAGEYNMERQQTAMFHADRIVRDLRYGFGRERFFFRLDTTGHFPEKVVLDFHQVKIARIQIDCIRRAAWLETSNDGLLFEKKNAEIELGIQNCIELGVPFEWLGWKNSGEKAAFVVQVFEKGIERERYPERGLIEFHAPSREFKLRNWFV